MGFGGHHRAPPALVSGHALSPVMDALPVSRSVWTDGAFLHAAIVPRVSGAVLGIVPDPRPASPLSPVVLRGSRHAAALHSLPARAGDSSGSRSVAAIPAR